MIWEILVVSASKKHILYYDAAYTYKFLTYYF